MCRPWKPGRCESWRRFFPLENFRIFKTCWRDTTVPTGNNRGNEANKWSELYFLHLVWGIDLLRLTIKARIKSRQLSTEWKELLSTFNRENWRWRLNSLPRHRQRVITFFCTFCEETEESIWVDVAGSQRQLVADLLANRAGPKSSVRGGVTPTDRPGHVASRLEYNLSDKRASLLTATLLPHTQTHTHTLALTGVNGEELLHHCHGFIIRRSRKKTY